jgi:hypothetical protein
MMMYQLKWPFSLEQYEKISIFSELWGVRGYMVVASFKVLQELMMCLRQGHQLTVTWK